VGLTGIRRLSDSAKVLTPPEDAHAKNVSTFVVDEDLQACAR
jgi:hypothetical protein